MGEYSSLLYAELGAVRSMGSAIDMGATMTTYNLSPTEQDADSVAIATDWHVVGNELRKAMNEYDK